MASLCQGTKQGREGKSWSCQGTALDYNTRRTQGAGADAIPVTQERARGSVVGLSVGSCLRTWCLFLEGVQGSFLIRGGNAFVIATFLSSSYGVFHCLPVLEGGFLAGQAREESGGSHWGCGEMHTIFCL